MRTASKPGCAIWQKKKTNPSIICSCITLSSGFCTGDPFERRIHVAQGIEFENVLTGIRVFLLPVYESILSEDEFFDKWHAGASEWTRR